MATGLRCDWITKSSVDLGARELSFLPWSLWGILGIFEDPNGEVCLAEHGRIANDAKALRTAGEDPYPSCLGLPAGVNCSFASQWWHQRKNKGGAPRKYDWAAFIQEVVRIANTPDGLPDWAQLTKDMKEWCLNNWGIEPAESLILRGIFRSCTRWLSSRADNRLSAVIGLQFFPVVLHRLPEFHLMRWRHGRI